MRRFRRERGASAVLFGLLLIPLVGAGGFAVDVGALYAEKAQLQNGADSVALEVAIACANGAATCSASDPQGLAGSNALDGVADIDSITFPDDNLVTVTTNTEDLGVRHPLASILPGVADSTVVHATGSAEWGVPVRGNALALAIGYCEFADHPPQEGVANPTKILVEYNTGTRRTCPGAFAPGGFGWLPSLDCSIYIDVNDPWVDSKTGNSNTGTGCTDSYMATLVGQTVFIPIYDDFVGSGTNVKFHIAKFAAFKITGFKISGSNAYTDSAAPRCNGACRGIQGYFMKFVSVSDAFELGPGSDLGAKIVRLTLRTS
ncbi:TadE/TadG family type IV pilus assembly protein [Agromyces tardus]|nr:TadE/TadG family type IV pilus assembly protein [Agromyces tardus]